MLYQLKKIEADVGLPKVIVNDFSIDQKCLYMKFVLQYKELLLPNWHPKILENVSCYRWLTITANRILRLCVPTAEPSHELSLLYVTKVYSKTWFLIKTPSACKYGAKHLFHLIKSSIYLPLQHRNSVGKVIQRNAFLLTMKMY